MSLSTLNSVQSRWTLLALAGVAVAAWDFAVGEIVSRPKTSRSLDAQATYVTTPRRLTTQEGPAVLHDVSYDSPSGTATVRWFDGDLEPTGPRSYAQVSVYVDGARVASTIKGSFAGTYGDGPGDLVWHGGLTRGRHRIVVQLDHADGGWGLPYADPAKPGVDVLIVQTDGAGAT
jgi:hypothetical protein